MRSRVAIKSFVDRTTVIVAGGTEKNEVEIGQFYALLDKLDGSVMAIFRADVVKYSISFLKLVWAQAIQTDEIEVGTDLLRMAVVERQAWSTVKKEAG